MILLLISNELKVLFDAEKLRIVNHTNEIDWIVIFCLHS
jgi:hypothetical protein